MAIIQFSQTVTVSGFVDVPDSQLKSYLRKFEANSASFDIDVVIDKDTKELTKDSTLSIDVDWDEVQFELIEKDNGSTYIWDGENLEKDD